MQRLGVEVDYLDLNLSADIYHLCDIEDITLLSFGFHVFK